MKQNLFIINFREKFKPGSLYDGEINASQEELEQWLQKIINEVYILGVYRGKKLKKGENARTYIQEDIGFSKT